MILLTNLKKINKYENITKRSRRVFHMGKKFVKLKNNLLNSDFSKSYLYFNCVVRMSAQIKLKNCLLQKIKCKNSFLITKLLFGTILQSILMMVFIMEEF